MWGDRKRLVCWRLYLLKEAWKGSGSCSHRENQANVRGSRSMVICSGLLRYEIRTGQYLLITYQSNSSEEKLEITRHVGHKK